jgi:hypothetical protein
MTSTRGTGSPSHWARRVANISLAKTRMCCGLFCYVENSVMWSQFVDVPC